MLKDKTLKMQKMGTNVLRPFCFVFILFFSLASSAQVSSSVDSTSIKIGEQIHFNIAVETDSTATILFPEGQTFIPMELVEALPTDTSKTPNKWLFTKKYALTQFDSGTYTIPQQKVILNGAIQLTDSVTIEVANVVVDTTKQKLYDIKPIIEVDRASSNWWKYLLGTLLVLGLLAFLIYWFIWREKPLTKEEKIALLPPYERAKQALIELDNAHYLEKDEIKAYYSELTNIIRTYLDEKVYNRALESTTDELIERLSMLRDANRIDLDHDTIRNIETIFKRADLVKFAKSRPNIELAKMDRTTIDDEIDHVKESLPEPTEEERLQDLKYQEEQAKKKKRRQVRLTIAAVCLAIILVIVGVVAKYGFTYSKDKVFGNDALALLEKDDWVMSEYGAPPIIITTPEVLERQVIELPDEVKDQIEIAVFAYGGIDKPIDILVSNFRFNAIADPNNPEAKPKFPEIDLAQKVEAQLQELEKRGATNIITKNEQFITPNGQEGLKTFGTGDFVIEEGEEAVPGNYIILSFTTENILQQITLIWGQDDDYSQQIIDRVVASIELLKLEEEDK